MNTPEPFLSASSLNLADLDMIKRALSQLAKTIDVDELDQLADTQVKVGRMSRELRKI